MRISLLKVDDTLHFFAKDALLSATHRRQHPTQLLASYSKTQTLTHCSSDTDWDQEEAEKNSQAANDNAHLWEESWDDDDAAEDFSKQLQCVSPLPSNLPTYLSTKDIYHMLFER